MTIIFDYATMSDEELCQKADETADLIKKLGEDFRNSTECHYTDVDGHLVGTRELINQKLSENYVRLFLIDEELNKRLELLIV